MKTLRLFTLSLVTAGLFAGNLFAEDKPASPAIPRATTPSQPNKLETVLKETGIPFEKKMDEKTKLEYFVVKEYSHENFYFEIEESKDKHYTWIYFPCGKVPETGIPSEIMEKLMSENSKMGTSFFAYYPKTRMISLKMSLSTASLDAKILKNDIHWMLKDASRTRNLWDSNQWNKTASEK